MALLLRVLHAIVPKKKLSAYVLGLITAVLAVVAGIQAPDIKDEFCSAPNSSLPVIAEPKVEAPVVATPKVEEIKK